ncbi:MAG TPA: cytochrome b/b6 domain-containing protein [Acidimicrobiales bacterium]|nr:cytochrome b/b6 domain-containing protein [Acidimicrobiales bacterium]
MRFDRVERWVHWTQAVLFLVLFATAAALYIPGVSELVGRRELVKNVHVLAGVVLPLPVTVGALGRRGRALRADLGRADRFTPHDWAWLRSFGRARGLRTGKFNAGQKLNAAFTGGSILVMLATGAVMRWYEPFPLSWRTGATFVHDVVAAALFVTVAGHIVLASRDPESLGAMKRGGFVSRAWAARHAPAWLDELDEKKG